MRGEGIRARKALGQNFLVDRNVVARIADAVDIGPEDRILEVGPGKGALTELLAARCARLVAVELDTRLVPVLRREFSSNPRVEIVHDDILKLDLRSLLASAGDGRWKVAANLPYNISTPVLFKFLDHIDLFSRMVLMLQKEVGDRLAASPGTKDYGTLSVFFQLHFNVARELIVRPGSFHPVPKVDSVVLSFVPLEKPREDVGDEQYFRRMVKGAFSMRRKTLWNCFKGADLGLSGGQLAEALETCGIDPVRRGETLSLGEFAALSRAMIALGGN